LPRESASNWAGPSRPLRSRQCSWRTEILVGAQNLGQVSVASLDPAGLQRLASEKLLEVISAAQCHTAWVSGSLVERLGNRGSDVDIFVVVEALSNDLPATHQDPDHWTHVFVIERTRFDIEFWPVVTIDALARKLQAVCLDDLNVHTYRYLDYWESEFIHRLYIGLPLLHESAFRALRKNFDRRLFSRYLFESGIRRFNDAFDDTAGMLAHDQSSCAALRARETVEAAIDVLMYGSGITNDKAKFRTLKMQRLVEFFPEYRRYEETLWRFETGLPADPAERHAYAEEALRFAADLTGFVQDRVHALAWEHIGLETGDRDYRPSSLLP
jgi:hypothetical protein